MNKVAVWGCGDYGKMALRYLISNGENVVCVVDNNKEKWGAYIYGVQIISPAQFVEMKDVHVYISVNVSICKEIEEQCKNMGIRDYSFFDFKLYSDKERLISYSAKRDMEDVVLYHALKEESDIFYIDVGSNDPFERNVTKLLYDMKNAHGINIDPQKGYIDMTKRERPRDINLCVALGDKEDKLELYYQAGYSTVIKENVKTNDCYHETVDVITLNQVFDKYCNDEDIHFLKIDAEGSEAKILLGADFKQYRPWIIVIEATNPGTMDESAENWEYMLLDNKYKYIRTVGVNSFYLAEEKSMLQDRLLSIEELKKIYCIYNAELSV